MTGCAASNVSNKRLDPIELIRLQCADPVTLPDRGLTQREVERFWGVDRTNLAKCDQ